MNLHPLLPPLLVMIGWVFFVWCWLVYTRVNGLRENEIHPEKFRTAKARALLPERSLVAGEHFANLFELPVLFYVACLLAIATATSSIAIVALAWAFVVFRVLHSVIHLGYNRVMHRFYAYLASAFSLWALWGLIVFQLVG